MYERWMSVIHEWWMYVGQECKTKVIDEYNAWKMDECDIAIMDE